jgi:hypothetical protein
MGLLFAGACRRDMIACRLVEHMVFFPSLLTIIQLRQAWTYFASSVLQFYAFLAILIAKPLLYAHAVL